MKLSFKILWIFPFIFFLGGYLISTLVLSQKSLPTPHLIGLTIQEAVLSLSSSNVNLRVLQEKETIDLPAGTILSQTPFEGTLIKPYQSVFVVLSKQAPLKKVPDCVGKSKNEIQELLKKENMSGQFFSLAHLAPKDRCIGTAPRVGAESAEKIIVYMSEGLQKLVVIPSLYGKSLKEMTDFLQEYDVQWTIVHHGATIHSLNDCIVVDQRPLAGSINALNSLMIHLYCS